VNLRPGPEADREVAAKRIIRHALADRVFHWVTAASVLTLLATAFLPILGWRFPWVTAHWIAGWLLIAAIVFHTIRALFWQSLRSMAIGRADVAETLGIVRYALRRTRTPPNKPGKYSMAQKLIHHLFAVVVLVVSVTGALMMVKIDTPWWNRNPYWLGDDAWGLIYVLHDFAALMLITMVIGHVYFALRPEKLLFTRAMIRGWITRDEYRAYHDPKRWQVEK
jgi:formate dehydrogenase subunit gamma